MEDGIDGCLGKPLFVPRVDVNPRRGEERFGKVSDNPLVAIVDIAKAQTLPVGARDHQPAFAAPIPRTGIARGGRVHAMDRLDFVRANRLVFHQVVNFGHARRVRGQEVVSDVDVPFALPEWKAGVGYMPCPHKAFIAWGNAFGGLLACIDRGKPNNNRRCHVLGRRLGELFRVLTPQPPTMSSLPHQV